MKIHLYKFHPETGASADALTPEEAAELSSAQIEKFYSGQREKFPRSYYFQRESDSVVCIGWTKFHGDYERVERSIMLHCAKSYGAECVFHDEPVTAGGA